MKVRLNEPPSSPTGSYTERAIAMGIVVVSLTTLAVSATLFMRGQFFFSGLLILICAGMGVIYHLFSKMTKQLLASSKTTTAIGEVDRLILSGATNKKVVQHLLASTREIHGIDSYVYLWKKTPLFGRLFFHDGQRVCENPIEMSINLSSEDDHREITRTLGALLNRQIHYCHDIRHEGGRIGLFLKTGEEPLNASASHTISELTDRLSVALASSNRERTLFRQANYDALTGLLNRQAFTDRLHHALQRAHRENGHGAVLFVDLDRFKQVNDTQGHKAGDELLSIVASRLEANMRETDSIARLGGDEFGILVGQYKNETDLVRICTRIMEEVSRPITINRLENTVDASIGVSVFPKDGTDTQVLLMRADTAMYKAKELAGSAFAFFDDILNKRTEQRIQIETELRQALRDDKLYLCFQQIVNLKSGTVESAEGLMRWHGSQWLPNDFIPIAEETGMIHEFTSVLIRQSVSCIQKCASAGMPLSRVSINLSSRQLTIEGFAADLLAQLDDFGGNPDDFEVEITESAFVTDSELVARELTTLRNAGVTVALDDFGTGISSLNMLRNWPLDILKIDKSLMDEMLESRQTRMLIKNIIEIAHNLSLRVTAEGVETNAQMAELKDMGCDLIQGFVVSRPQSLSDFVHTLHASECALVHT